MAKLTKQETVDLLMQGYDIIKAWSRMYGTYYYLQMGDKSINNVNTMHVRSLVKLCDRVSFAKRDGITELTTYRLNSSVVQITKIK